MRPLFVTVLWVGIKHAIALPLFDLHYSRGVGIAVCDPARDCRIMKGGRA